MGPGPSDVPSRVLDAISRPTLGHLDPVFADMMEELKGLLRYAFNTRNAVTFPVSGPGSVGMETCFVNLINPGEKVIVCRNGVFGGRMIENVERCGGIAVVVEDAWGKAVDPNKLADALKAHPDTRIVAFVQAETSTGALSDAKTLCEIARRHGCLTIVDAVTSLGGSPLMVDEWGIDAIYSGSQKCLSCPPGLSPVSFSDAAVAKIKARPKKAQSWFMDLNLVLGYWGGGGGAPRTYHHTAPTNSLYGLHESLVILQEEGLEKAWARHTRNHLAFRAGLENLGLNFLVDEAHRLPQLNSVFIPQGVDEKALRKTLLDEHRLEIGAGLGDFAGKVWRFGLMGHSSRIENVVYCLNALEAVFTAGGMKLERGAAVAAAHQIYAAQAQTEIAS
ncbi:MAG: alanine--glyoxylate aminotransferase family protein [Nitrosomonadales bacterium]|nr:alanine--glyoxylate aminotransferase family protein [Nitrosomonadales bacterium]